MQPLPPQITTRVFESAATSFATAASSIANPTVAGPLLSTAARELYQGIPSLRMTTPRDIGAPVSLQLDVAAGAALALAKQMATTPAADYSGHRQAIESWAQLAAGASALVSPTHL